MPFKKNARPIMLREDPLFSDILYDALTARSLKNESLSGPLKTLSEKNLRY